VRPGRVVGCVLLAVVAGGCGERAALRAPRPPADTSGFLDDYSRLRPGGPDEARLVWRKPDAHWSTYDKILFEPVAVWRSGRRSLERVPEGDLLRLAADLERAVRGRLGEDWQLVDGAGPGVLRIRLAITEARAADPVLDVLTTTMPSAADVPTDDGPLGPETLGFVAAAAIEGEIADAQTGEVLAQGLERRTEPGPIRSLTWAEVDRFFAAWANRVCGRLERARRGTLR